ADRGPLAQAGAAEAQHRPTFNVTGFKDGNLPGEPVMRPVLPPPPASAAPAAAAAGADANTRQAPAPLGPGRQAPAAGAYPGGVQLAGKAKSLRPNLGLNDDTPDKVVADVQKAAMAKAMGAPPGPVKPSKPAEPAEDPKALLRRGRELLAAGQLDEAAQAGNRARAAAQ